MTAATLIESLGVYLPPREVSTAELIRGCRHPVRFPLERMTGIRSRRVAGDGEFAIDLAKQAITRCLATSRHGPEDVDLVISAAIARVDAPGFMVSYEPSTALRLRHHFGFDRAMVFDVRSACSGMFAGLYIVDTLIREGVIGCGLVVSGEYITHLATTAQLEIKELMDARLACLTLGDAGAAVMLERASTPDVGFAAVDLRTFGRYAECCVAGPTDQPHGGAIMFTDALQLTDAAARHGSDHALGTLHRAGWPCDGFDHLIMHQTSRTALTSASRAINRLLGRPVCHEDNTIDNLERRGNTATTSHFVALADGIESGRIKSGDRLIFAVSGSGLTLGTALYTLDDLPDRLTGRTAALRGNGKGVRDGPAVPQSTGVRISAVGVAPREATDHRDSVALLQLAVADCMHESSRDARSTELLIYAGTYRSRFITEPAMAALLAGALNVENTLAFDIFNGGVAVLNACFVAAQMIRAKRTTTALVVAAETENNAACFPQDLLGIESTSSALLLEADPRSGKGFGRFLFRSFTEHRDAFVSCLTNREGKAYLQFVRQPDIEQHYVAAIAATVAELLRMEAIGIEHVAKVFAPQISAAFLTRLGDAICLPRERFVDAVGDGRDLFTSSLAFALRHAAERKLVHDGDLGLIVTVGSGIQVGCALYHF